MRLEVEKGARGLALRGDAERLTQVLFNLIENATQHSSPGGEILIAIRGHVGGRCLLEVIDRGAGIAPDAEDRLFEPFFSTRKGGTGLGLSIVRNILEAHGGSIRLRNNEPGPGCTAEVSLPCLSEEGA
jgi:signal transduction histidine kinase